MSARAVALDTLVRVEAGAYANLLLPALLRRSGLEARDRAFTTDLVYGTLREQRRLDAFVAPHCRRPVDRLDPPVRAALRLGAYQLAHGVPAHAAVGETVTAAPARARPLVNAVLRALAGDPSPWPEPQDPGTRLSYPDVVVEILEGFLGQTDAHDALAAMNAAPAVALRPNPLRTTTAQLVAELRAEGVEVAPGTLAPEALVVRGTGDPAVLRCVAEGRATPQDQASQAVAALVEPAPGHRALDVAAAPGGKATALAERVAGPSPAAPGAGFVVAVDRDGARLALVGRAAARLGLAPAIAGVVADARHLPLRTAAGFDRVLVDAPCSGLGVLARRADARWRFDPADVARLAARQRALLAAAAREVAPGGLLVYSVCTLTAPETVAVAEWFESRAGGFTRLDRPPSWRVCGPGALVLPQDAGTDGMFVARWRRTGAGAAHRPAAVPGGRGGSGIASAP